MNEQEEVKKKGFSLRVKNTLLFVGLFIFLIGILWLLNTVFLQDYYLRQQLGRLEKTRELLEELVRDQENEELQLQLTRECESSGIAAVLAKEDALGSPVILFTSGEDRGPWRIGEAGRSALEPSTDIYKQTDSYTISRLEDPLTRMDKVECRGTLLEGEQSYIYLLSLPMARIQESAALSNRFLLIMGNGVLLLGALLFFLMSQHVAKPIVTLSRLSRKMADLDFSERFEGHSGDEIQTLGESINHLSETLKITIDDLKKANLALEADVREKEEENRRRQELLANISHELKTPIALIQGYAEGLRDGMCEEEETRIRYSDTILDEANRMNRLVRQLLSLDEMESGQMEVERTAFDLTEVIRELTAAFQMRKDEKQVRWEIDLPESLPVRADELLVEQIVQNYLSNAWHHVKEGGLIRVSAAAESSGSRVDVYNDGEPLPEEALEQVWNKFYKVDKARTRSYGGSGIGLSVVKAATEILGGSCSVENRAGGVCFTARL